MQTTKDITPTGEPVAWATIVALALGALASYGFGVTDELREMLVYLVPIIAGAIWARSQVTPVAKLPTGGGDTARGA